MNTLMYERTESLPGYRNVRIGTRIECQPGISAAVALVSARAFVLEAIDIELEADGQPARYDTTSLRGDLLTLRGIVDGQDLSFIVPPKIRINGFVVEVENHRVSYLRKKYQPIHLDTIRLKVESPAQWILECLESADIVAVVSYAGELSDLYAVLKPTQVPLGFDGYVCWYENENIARQNIEQHDDAVIVDSEKALEQIEQLMTKKKERYEYNEIPF